MAQVDPEGLPPRITDAVDRLLAVQRPVVLLHLRNIRRRHPDATPEQVIRILERRYLTAVTTGGAAVGATAMVPAVGTATALALSGAETVGFLEATTLFAQSVTEVHGIALTDPERSRALVLTLLIGGPAQDLLRQFASQASGGPSRSAFWGEAITRTLPRSVVTQFREHVRRVYLPRLLVKGTGGVVGRAIPFGIGAVIGGVGNQVFGRAIIRNARSAFGPSPTEFGSELAVIVGTPRPDRAPRGSATRTPIVKSRRVSGDPDAADSTEPDPQTKP